MRVTRGRTGKLPTPALRKGFVTEFEDDASPPPSPTRKSIPKVVQEPAPASDPEEEPEPVPEKKPDPVFEIFKTHKKLKEGLCIIRVLGKGRYELVSLKDIDQQHFSSEKIGAVIESNAARRNILALGEEDWEVAKFNCGQAVRSAG